LKPLGVAVIGAGHWGPNLARNFLATPAWTHFEVALTCLEAGKYVLVEKPFACTVAEGEKLVATAQRRQLVLMCDHAYCYTAAVRRMRQLILEGALGDIQYFDSVPVNLGLVQPDVDIFWDLAAHDLAILDCILPDGCLPPSVGAQGADPIGVDHPCVGYVTVPLTGGAISHVHVNWLSRTKIRTTVVGGFRRTLVWDGLNPAQRLSMYDKGVDLIGPVDRQLPRAALAGVVRELAAAVRECREPLTGGTSGLRVLRILEAVPRSLAAGGTVVALQSNGVAQGAR